MERDFLEACLAEGLSLAEIGRRVERDHTTVRYWLKKHGLVAPQSARYAPRGGIAREDLEPLVKAGLTLSEMAARLAVSIATVQYWLRKYELRTVRSARRRAPDPNRPKYAEFECQTHGVVRFILEGRGYYRCTKCRMDAVVCQGRLKSGPPTPVEKWTTPDG